MCTGGNTPIDTLRGKDTPTYHSLSIWAAFVVQYSCIFRRLRRIRRKRHQLRQHQQAVALYSATEAAPHQNTPPSVTCALIYSLNIWFEKITATQFLPPFITFFYQWCSEDYARQSLCVSDMTASSLKPHCFSGHFRYTYKTDWKSNVSWLRKDYGTSRNIIIITNVFDNCNTKLKGSCSLIKVKPNFIGFLIPGRRNCRLYCCGFSADSSKTHNPSGGYFPYIRRIFVGQMMFFSFICSHQKVYVFDFIVASSSSCRSFYLI